MHMKDVLGKSKEVKVNQWYDLDMYSLLELVHGCSNPYDLAVASFRIGYLQGGKAEKKRREKDGKKEKN